MQSLPIINQIYETYKDIVEMNYKLEKRWRYQLGIRLENSVLEYMELLVMAKSAPKPLKAGYLLKAMAKLEISILELRLLLEFKLVNETKVFQIHSKFEESGRMLGGWIRAAQAT